MRADSLETRHLDFGAVLTPSDRTIFPMGSPVLGRCRAATPAASGTVLLSDTSVFLLDWLRVVIAVVVIANPTSLVRL